MKEKLVYLFKVGYDGDADGEKEVDPLYQVLICDDEQEHLLATAELTEHILAEAGIRASITCLPGRSALLAVLEERRDHCLLLLDILLGQDNGVELARELRTLHQDLGIILTTTSRDYIFEGYDVHAIQYLLKPLNQDRLRQAILYDYEHSYRSAYLSQESKSKTFALRLSEMLYLESVHRGVVAHMADGANVELTGTMAAVTARLPSRGFHSCHRIYCVNLDWVKSIHYGSVELSQGERLPVGRTYQKEFERAYVDAVRKLQ